MIEQEAEARDEIILIGPMGIGKSTQGTLLSEALGIPRCAMDDLRWGYYREIGYDDALAKQTTERDGFLGLYHYWKPFEAYAVERLLADNQNCVIDFGAGHSVYEDDVLFARVQKAMLPYRNVIFLLPSPDLDESIRLLRQRGDWDGMVGTFDFHEHCIKHHSNHDLARCTVYTEGKTPEQTRDEILRITSGHG